VPNGNPDVRCDRDADPAPEAPLTTAVGPGQRVHSGFANRVPEALAALLHDRKAAQTAALAESAEPIAKPGEIGHGRRRRANSTSPGGSTQAEYPTRRLARDRPDILERMKAGEHRCRGISGATGGQDLPTATVQGAIPIAEGTPRGRSPY
jgi:hypothetical protein